MERLQRAAVGRLAVARWMVMVLLAASSLSSQYAAAQPVCFTDRPVAVPIKPMYQENFGIAGLTHVTLAGAVHHGMKKVEVWLQTLAPGYHSPIHSQDQEEVLLVLKGRGILKTSAGIEPGSPATVKESLLAANHTAVIHPGIPHQIVNSGKKSMQLLHIIGRPPIRYREFDDWITPVQRARPVFPGPFDRKCLPGSLLGGGSNFVDDGI